MTNKHLLNYVMFYLLWTVLIAMGFWFLILSRETFLTGAAYYAGDSFTRGWQTRFFDKVLSAGIAVLIYFYATEGYLRAGRETRHAAAFFKTQADAARDFCDGLILLVLQQFAGGVWLRWVILAAELGLAWFDLWSPQPAKPSHHRQR